MISRIKALMVPLQPAQHLASGLAGQRVSVSVSQHPHTPPHKGCMRSGLRGGHRAAGKAKPDTWHP